MSQSDSSPRRKESPGREELIRSVDHVMKTSGCVVDMDSLMNRLERMFPGVDIGRLIFDPPSGKRMTAEQIVDEALTQIDP